MFFFVFALLSVSIFADSPVVPDIRPDEETRVSLRDPQNTQGKISGAVTNVMRSLGLIVRDLVEGTGSVLFLCVVATVYGVFHALGPGHQKTLVVGYLVAEAGGICTAARSASVAAFGHAVSVLALFMFLVFVGSAFGASDVLQSGKIVSRVSGLALVLVSVMMLYRRIHAFMRLFRSDRVRESAAVCSCGHVHGHDEPEGRDFSVRSEPTVIPVLLGSLVPCPGAAFFLFLGSRSGNLVRGIVAVCAVSVGMWITLFVVALLSLEAHKRGMKAASFASSRTHGLVGVALGVAGSAVVFAFAISLAL